MTTLLHLLLLPLPAMTRWPSSDRTPAPCCLRVAADTHAHHSSAAPLSLLRSLLVSQLQPLRPCPFPLLPCPPKLHPDAGIGKADALSHPYAPHKRPGPANAPKPPT